MANGTPGSGAPSSNRNVMIVLSYLWLLALIPLVVEKEDREVQWHAKHGLVLAVAELVFWVAFQIVMFMLGSFLGCLVAIFAPLIGLGFLILHIVAIVKGINGSRLIVPGPQPVRRQVLTRSASDRSNEKAAAHRERVDHARPGHGCPAGAGSAVVSARRPRRHSRLSSHAVARLRGDGRAVPVHAVLQPLRRSLHSAFRRRPRRLDGGQTRRPLRTVDADGDGGSAAGVERRRTGISPASET